MSFPTNPSNGDQHTEGSHTWQYEEEANIWRIVPDDPHAGLADVAISGSYSDLQDTPTIPPDLTLELSDLRSDVESETASLTHLLSATAPPSVNSVPVGTLHFQSISGALTIRRSNGVTWQVVGSENLVGIDVVNSSINAQSAAVTHLTGTRPAANSVPAGTLHIEGALFTGWTISRSTGSTWTEFGPMASQLLLDVLGSSKRTLVVGAGSAHQVYTTGATDGSQSSVQLGPSTVLARLASGGIVAATPAELRTLLDVLTTAQVSAAAQSEIASWVGAAPEALDTLIEIAEALGDADEAIEALLSAVGERALASDLTDHESTTTGAHGIPDPTTIVVDSDPRLTDARSPTSHTHTQSDVTGLGDALTALAPGATHLIGSAPPSVDASAVPIGTLHFQSILGSLTIRRSNGTSWVVLGGELIQGSDGVINQIEGIMDADPRLTPQVAATASIRALGTGSQQALPGNHSSVVDSRPSRARRYPSGRWIAPQGTPVASQTILRGRLYPVVLDIGRDVMLDRIAASVVDLGGAGSEIRLGIYSVTSTGTWGSLLVDAGFIDGNTAGVQELTINLALAAGVYFLTPLAQGGTSDPSLLALSPTIMAYGTPTFQTSPALQLITGSVYNSGGLPASPNHPTSYATNSPLIQVRIS